MLWFGIAIENALAERVNHGDEKRPKWVDKYTLEQLLDANFHLPKPPPKPKAAPPPSGFGLLLALAGQPGSGVKKYQYVKPS